MKTAAIQHIDEAMEQDAWAEARRLLLRELAIAPDDHWLTTRLATTYYEEKDYATALGWTEKALALAPQCPLVLWDHACALDMLGREEAAIRTWRKLIDRGAARLALDECGEGV